MSSTQNGTAGKFAQCQVHIINYIIGIGDKVVTYDVV